MATYFARKSGNINATDVWATTPSGTAGDFFGSFTTSDVLMSNGFTVTLNVNTTVGEIRNDTNEGATTGGSFTLSSSITLRANIIAGSATCVTHSSGNAIIIGNITGGSANAAYGVSAGSTGSLIVIGSIFGGTISGTSHGMNISAIGTVTITGNINGSVTTNAAGLNIAAATTISITGTISGASSGYGITVNANALMTITGTVIGGSGQIGILVVNNATITLSGTSIGGTFAGISNVGGTVSVVRAKGGPLASSSVGITCVSSVITNVEEIEYGDLGASPTSGPIRLTDKTTNVALVYRFLSTKKSLVDISSTNLVPVPSNVRSGTVYNNTGSTGTCVIPNANSVVYGVPVDNTTGSGILSPESVWNVLSSSIGTSGSIGERLKNVSTISTVGKQLEGVL